MKVKDWSKSDEWVESYVSALSDPNQLPGKLNRTWIEVEAARVGLVSDWRGWDFMESHATWYAALIKTGRLREVNSLEKKVIPRTRGKGTVSTVNALLRGRLRGTITAELLRGMI